MSLLCLPRISPKLNPAHHEESCGLDYTRDVAHHSRVALSFSSRTPKGFSREHSVAVQSFSTNANGRTSALVTITNGGPHTIHLSVGTQVRQPEGWVDSRSGLSNALTLTIVSGALPP